MRHVTLGKIMADYVAVSADKMLVLLVDKEQGDWLADEERFNDEEPLWFSESSHRVSPVRKAVLAADAADDLIQKADMDIEVKPYVVIVAANIINAEDMYDVWDDLDVQVVRFAKGSPSELTPFSKAVSDAEDNLSQGEFNKLRKILKKSA